MIVNAALTGCVHKRDDSLYVPMTPNEIAKDVYKCARAGANIFHIHAREKRDRAFEPAWSLYDYQYAVKRIREIEPSAIICLSTSGRHWQDFYKRADCLYVDPPPDMASLTMGSYNTFDSVSINPPETIRNLAEFMKKRGIRPELECFDIGHIHYAKHLIDKGVLERPFYFNLFLGNLGTVKADRSMMEFMINELPEGAYWSATGIGKYQFEIECLAVILGGGVRVGLEDYLWWSEGKLQHATNEGMVRRIVEFAASMGANPYTPEEVRAKLCLRSSC